MNFRSHYSVSLCLTLSHSFVNSFNSCCVFSDSIIRTQTHSTGVIIIVMVFQINVDARSQMQNICLASVFRSPILAYRKINVWIVIPEISFSSVQFSRDAESSLSGIEFSNTSTYSMRTIELEASDKCNYLMHNHALISVLRQWAHLERHCECVL